MDGVKFIWYLDGTGKENKLNTVASNEITIFKKKITLGENHQIFMKPEGNDNDGYIEYTAPMVKVSVVPKCNTSTIACNEGWTTA